MVDRARAAALLDAVRSALDDLDRYAGTIPLERLTADRDAQNMVLHAVYRAVQASIDLAHHVVSDAGLRVPGTYRAVFASLAEAGWIDGDLAGRLAGWAGLGNVIAHGYVQIDFRRVHAALLEREDLRRFVQAVAAQVRQE